MNQKPHFSPTSLDLLTRCGEAWRRRYLERERYPAGTQALRGKTLHQTAATAFRAKAAGQELSADDLRDAAATAFDHELQRESVAFSAEEVAAGMNATLGAVKDDSTRLAAWFGSEVLPDYDPILIEEPMRIELDGPYDLFGRVDLVAAIHGTTAVGVVDLKTAAKRKRQADADDSLQLTFYCAAAHMIIGAAPDEACLDVAVITSQGIKRQLISSSRDEADYDAMIERTEAAGRAIEAGVFLPAAPGSWWCSAKYCEFHSTCRFVRGARQ